MQGQDFWYCRMQINMNNTTYINNTIKKVHERGKVETCLISNKLSNVYDTCIRAFHRD